MKNITAGMLLASALVALGGCSKPEPAPTVNDAMTKVMEPKAELIWNTVSKAYNDVGDGLDPSKLSDADWKKLADASAAIKARAQQLVAAPEQLVVANSDEIILGSNAVGVKGKIGAAWEARSAEQIQAKIRADPKGFAQKAQILLEAADGMNRASTSRDTGQLYRITSELDGVCDGCHEPYWGTDEPPPFPTRDKNAIRAQ